MALKNIDKFLEFSESLKLVRNDYLENDGKKIIENIYTDLLPNNGVISKVVLPRTTVLVGRKGTGKSTIFQKAQIELDKNKKYLTIYIDVKSLYDNSSPKLPKEIESLPDSKELIKYLIYSNFVKEIILKTKEKLREQVEKNYIINVLNLTEIVLMDVYSELDNIERDIENVFKNLNATLVTSFKNSQNNQNENKLGFDLDGGVDKGVSGKLNLSDITSTSVKKEFDNTLVTYLDLKKCFIDNIVKIRDILKIKNLFILLDDYSEIDKYAQVLFMDWFIAPVNNLSEDFVKFKIATYPKRFYYGKLDNSKIDEISLDFFDAFYSIEKKSSTIDISRMEHLALDYTERLLNNRFVVYFPNNNWEDLFEMAPKELYEILFLSSMNTPRKMGFILSYCYESCLIHDTKISKSAIENASLRYYTDVVEKYFLVNEFICKPFDDKISNEHQYELLDIIVERQVHNKKYISQRQPKDTGHFYITNEIAYLLDNLELNGFISTYNKVKDDNNIFSTVYCLDFGLCKKYELIFGRPGIAKTNSHTLPALFNFNNLIIDYFNSTQVIRCENGHEFPYKQINEFKLFNMNCPTCMQSRLFSICEVEMKFTELKEKFIEQEENEKLKITFPEYMILNFLKVSQNSISFQRLSASQDISILTIANTIEKLTKKGWTEMDVSASQALKKDLVKITAKGVRITERIDKLINHITSETEKSIQNRNISKPRQK
jgi:DNA-binding PadR family transcriptional regulator